jgi:hypothetical protein
MKQTSWPDVTPINQKNYYTCVVLAFLVDGWIKKLELTAICVAIT